MMDQYASVNVKDNDIPDTWWGGLDRTPFQIENEHSPKFVTESALNTVPDDHTGLVFISDGVHEKRADLYEKGRRVCTVITFENGKRTEYSREGEVMGEFHYYPSQSSFYRRYYPTEEQRESLEKENSQYSVKRESMKHVVTTVLFLFLFLCLYFANGLTTIQLSIVFPVLCFLLCVVFFVFSIKYTKQKHFWLTCLVVSSIFGYLFSNGSTTYHVLIKHVFRIVLVGESVILPSSSSMPGICYSCVFTFLITLFLCV